MLEAGKRVATPTPLKRWLDAAPHRTASHLCAMSERAGHRLYKAAVSLHARGRMFPSERVRRVYEVVTLGAVRVGDWYEGDGQG